MAIVVTKEKNILSIRDTNKTGPYTLDINTGIFYGIKGNPVKSAPTTVNDHFRNCVCSEEGNVALTIRYLMRGSDRRMTELTRYSNLLIMADKLQSLGYVYRGYNDVIVSSEVETINRMWKEICKWMPTRGNQDIRDFLRFHKKRLWIESNHLLPDGHAFTEEMVDWMYARFGEIGWSEKRLHIIAGWLVQGLWNYETSSAGRFSRIRDLFQWADEMGTEISKGNFFKQWGDIKATYELRKNREVDRRLEKHQAYHKEALTFESDELMVVIPTTKQEFLDEASAQSNCVARLYMPKVANGETHVVFVRKKSEPNKSYITCEVGNDGQIYQYYLAYNYSVLPSERPAEFAFKMAYADHLRQQQW